MSEADPIKKPFYHSLASLPNAIILMAVVLVLFFLAHLFMSVLIAIAAAVLLPVLGVVLWVVLDDIIFPNVITKEQLIDKQNIAYAIYCFSSAFIIGCGILAAFAAFISLAIGGSGKPDDPNQVAPASFKNNAQLVRAMPGQESAESADQRASEVRGIESRLPELRSISFQSPGLSESRISEKENSACAGFQNSGEFYGVGRDQRTSESPSGRYYHLAEGQNYQRPCWTRRSGLEGNLWRHIRGEHDLYVLQNKRI